MPPSESGFSPSAPLLLDSPFLLYLKESSEFDRLKSSLMKAKALEHEKAEEDAAASSGEHAKAVEPLNQVICPTR